MGGYNHRVICIANSQDSLISVNMSLETFSFPVSYSIVQYNFLYSLAVSNLICLITYHRFNCGKVRSTDNKHDEHVYTHITHIYDIQTPFIQNKKHPNLHNSYLK